MRHHNSSPNKQPRIGLATLGLLTQKLALLLRSGVPLLDALGAITLQHGRTPLGHALSQVHQDIAGGRRLSTSLRERFRRLPEHYVELIYAGEESGSLGKVLERLGADLEHEHALRREVAQASLYPIFVSAASVLIGAAILAFIVPAFKELYADFGVELPALTRASLAASNALIGWWPIMLPTTAALGFALVGLVTSPRGTLLVRGTAQHLPLYGGFLRACALSRLTGALGTLIGAGIAIPSALALAAGAAPHRAARSELDRWSHMTLQGHSLSSLARSTLVFPPEMSHMISLGESSGRLEEVLGTLSGLYHREASEQAARIKVLIEPLLIALSGVIVGTLLLAVYLPIFELGGVPDS